MTDRHVYDNSRRRLSIIIFREKRSSRVNELRDILPSVS